MERLHTDDEQSSKILVMRRRESIDRAIRLGEDGRTSGQIILKAISVDTGRYIAHAHLVNSCLRRVSANGATCPTVGVHAVKMRVRSVVALDPWLRNQPIDRLIA